MGSSEFIRTENLEVYQLSRNLSSLAWEIYEKLDWNEKKLMGEQFVRSVDSVGANIAEGYKRYHHLDRIKFYYNARASLNEACGHWLGLLYERGKIDKEFFEKMRQLEKNLSVKLANFIRTTYIAKRNSVETH